MRSRSDTGVVAGGVLGGRLHPGVIAVWSLGSLGPVAVLLLAGGAPGRVAGAAAVLAFTGAVVRYLRFRWHIDGTALVLEQGLLQRRRRMIPFERIQAVELVRTLRHRLLGVVELRVETIGGGASEGRLEALDPHLAEQLRAVLLRRDDRQDLEGAPARPSAPALVALSPAMLVAAGLTGGRVGVAAALIGVGQDVLGERVVRVLPALAGWSNPADLVLTAAAVLAGAFVLSLVATTLTYWGFTVRAEQRQLRVRRGLLEQRVDTLPLGRIQALHVEENLLRRVLGLAAVRVEVAGRAGGEQGRVSGVLLPLGSRQQALALVAAVLDRPRLPSAVLSPMPLRARSRRLARAAVATVAAVGVCVALAGAPGLLAVLAAVPAALLAIESYRALGRAEHGDVLVARRGWLVRRTSYVPRDRLQSLALRQSPSQRARGLATLLLQIARSPGRAGDPALVDLDACDAERLLERLSRRRVRVAD